MRGVLEPPLFLRSSALYHVASLRPIRNTVQKLLLIGAGGAAGALLRYALSGLAYRFLGETFPWGTFIVNVVGCFVIGLLWAVVERTPISPALHVFVFTGVLGAFTTFSTYGLETFNLLRDGEIMLGLANFLASNLIGVGAVIAGFFIARIFLSIGGAS